MTGLDQLALLDAIDRTTRELRILRAMVLDRERQAVEAAEQPSRIPKISAVDYAALTHTVAIPEDVAEHIEACGE